VLLLRLCECETRAWSGLQDIQAVHQHVCGTTACCRWMRRTATSGGLLSWMCPQVCCAACLPPCSLLGQIPSHCSPPLAWQPGCLVACSAQLLPAWPALRLSLLPDQLQSPCPQRLWHFHLCAASLCPAAAHAADLRLEVSVRRSDSAASKRGIYLRDPEDARHPLTFS
jgi:hypothetical protein